MKPMIRNLFSLLLAFACVAAVADERTGREFSELVRELNKELAEAKVKVRKIEAEHQAKQKVDVKKVLPAREEALEALRDRTEALNGADTPESKAAAEAEVQDQVLEVARLSADFLENQKNELVSQDKQLEVIEQALAKVITKLDRLSTLAEKNKDEDAKADLKKQKVMARKELQSMARVIEMLAKSNPDSQHWHSVRQTIMLQDAVLKRESHDATKLQDMLQRQKQVYEQTHAQIVLARQGIAEERKLVAQVALGEVARSMLRKAAGLLLGSNNIENIGEAALAKTELRQASLLKFVSQDQDGVGLEAGGESGDNQAPGGYSDYLSKEIN